MDNQEDLSKELAECKELIRQSWGALNFILAFYDPQQRYLDTEAWKQAEASGRRCHALLSDYLGISLGKNEAILLAQAIDRATT